MKPEDLAKANTEQNGSKKIIPLPPQKYLRECFTYIADGNLLWLQRPEYHFETKKGHSVFTRQTAGKIAGCVNLNGRKGIVLNFNSKRINLKTHRVIWALLNGDIPYGMYVDHINGNTSDNRVENLRLASPSENCMNRKIHTNNTQGVKGVSWNKRDKRFVARIMVDYKPHIVGNFLTIEEAELAIMNARQDFHKDFTNHGEHKNVT